MPQTWSCDGVRQERTGWRDAEISARHRKYGFDCPAVDLDFLLCEYSFSKPVALIEYKHYQAQPPDLTHPTYQTLAKLASGYQRPLPFLVAFYWPGIWSYRVLPVTPEALKYFVVNQQCTEREFVTALYKMRDFVLTEHLARMLDLKDELPVDLDEESA